MRLTERNIKALKLPESGYILAWDDDLRGFGVRVTSGGVRSFVLQYRTESQQRRTTLGRWTPGQSAGLNLTATAARRKAKAILSKINLGGDPEGEKQKRRQSPSFAEVAAEYLERHASKKKSGFKDVA